MDAFSNHSRNGMARRAAALALIGVVVFLAMRGPTGFLISLPLVVIAGILLLPDLTRPVTWMIDALLGTGPGGGKPPLDLRLARFYEREARWEEALEEYRRVVQFHPGVVEAYMTMMTLQARLGRPAHEVERTCRAGLRHVRDPELRGDLERARSAALEQVVRP